MRLIRLRIRNIASLKGEHEIDFKEIHKHSALFAITGETGAGKSSILNSIGLALYGEIYKRNINQVDIVTLGEKDGSIELIFQVKGKFYLADWRAKVRKQSGELYSTPQSPTRFLYTLERDEFNSPKVICPQKASELLNLDFDQFCKCIILNQGEFSKFLTSTFTERKEILEKIYPGEQLELMGKELKLELEKIEKEKNDIEIRLNELKGEKISGDVLIDQKKTLEADLKRNEEIFKTIENLDRHFVSLFSYYEKWKTNQHKKEGLQNGLILETSKFNLILSEEMKLSDDYQKIKKFQESELPRLHELLKKEQTLKHLEEKVTQINKRKEKLSFDSKELMKKIEATQHREKLAKEKLSELKKTLTLNIEKLKEHKDKFDQVFEIFTETELLKEEIKGKAEQLNQLTETGKSIKDQVEALTREIQKIPDHLNDKEKEIELKKQKLQGLIEKKQLAEIKYQDLILQIDKLKVVITELSEKESNLIKLTKQLQDELSPLEATLKLQEVIHASEICINHALQTNGDCPVCHSKVAGPHWLELKESLTKMDLGIVRERAEVLSKSFHKNSRDLEHITERIKVEKDSLFEKEKALQILKEEKSVSLPPLHELDTDLQEIKKQSWTLESLKKDLSIRQEELNKVRELYLGVNKTLTSLQNSQSLKDQKLKECERELSPLIPAISKETIKLLKEEAKKLSDYLEIEGNLLKTTQEIDFFLDHKNKIAQEINQLTSEASEEEDQIRLLKEDLRTGLHEKKASELIEKLNEDEKRASLLWQKHLEEQRKQEYIIKDYQGRLFQLGDLLKDIEIQFAAEVLKIKELSLEGLREEFKKLNQSQISFETPEESLISIQQLINDEKDKYRSLTNESRMKYSEVSTRLSDWEKVQDKINLFTLRENELKLTYSRKNRLYEVLGKDELRTFVLALVEEGLIHQTNLELQKLCQGRYEIIHQTKSMRMTPEFYILDKFREGNKRKVSTLSGGETFMVSLAMALALAELTRGQAEIDSLFIDEGFGTLDQESLQDVLDMLVQIQTRGLMVGVISHIKVLTNALPVNLQVSKNQAGNSTVELVMN